MLKFNLRGFFDDPARAMSSSEILALYRWLSIPRYLSTAVSAAAVAIFWRLDQVAFDPRPVLFILVPCFIAVSVIIDTLIRKNVRPFLMLRLQLVLDLVTVTTAVLLTGASRSPFALLYILVIISASLLSTRTLVIFCALAAIMYEGVAFADRAGLLTAFHQNAVSISGQDPVSVVFFCLIAALIAFQSSYYVSRIRQKDQEVLKLKDEFLYRTIHDLRSPSTAMRYIVDKYRKDPVIASHPDSAADFLVMERSLTRMTVLIEDLLKIAAGENAEFKFQRDPVNIQAVVAASADELSRLMSTRHLTFTVAPVEKLPLIEGDTEKLKEVFNNFFDNAIKYNRDGGSITVKHYFDNTSVITDIADTGIGISKTSAKKLFSPFFRGDIGMDIPGTGLGLYMTRKLIQKMGGSVSFISTQGSGTTFTLTLPRYYEKGEKPPKPA